MFAQDKVPPPRCPGGPKKGSEIYCRPLLCNLVPLDTRLRPGAMHRPRVLWSCLDGSHKRKSRQLKYCVYWRRCYNVERCPLDHPKSISLFPPLGEDQAFRCSVGFCRSMYDRDSLHAVFDIIMIPFVFCILPRTNFPQNHTVPLSQICDEGAKNELSPTTAI